MSQTSCPRSPASLRAARSGGWTAELRAHLDACADCRLAVELAAEFDGLAAATAAAAPPPRPPGALWLRAELARRSRARARRARWSLAAAVAAPSLSFLGFSLARGLEGWSRLLPAATPGPLTATAAAAVLGLGLAVLVAASAPVERAPGGPGRQCR